MIQLLTVIALKIIEVTYPVKTALISISFLFLTMFYFDGVDYSNCREARLLFLIPIIAIALWRLIFASFFGGFRVVLKSFGFLRLAFLGTSFWLLGPEIVHWRTLNIGFDGYGKTASRIILIGLTDIEVRLESCFGLSVDSFFNYLIKTIEFSTALFHFYPQSEF